MQKAGGLLLVQVEVDPEDEDELNRWYDEEHIEERLSSPGFLRVRRYVSTGPGKLKFLALYDLDSPAALETPEYLHLKGEGATPWTNRIESEVFKSFTRTAFALISDSRKK